MSAAKKKELFKYPSIPGKSADKQEALRVNKMEMEKLRGELQKRILDNPKTAKKAALLISSWVQKNVSTKKSNK